MLQCLFFSYSNVCILNGLLFVFFIVFQFWRTHKPTPALHEKKIRADKSRVPE